jgi:hypothetical protein
MTAEIRLDPTLKEFSDLLNLKMNIKKGWHPTLKDANNTRTGAYNWFDIEYIPGTVLYNLKVGSEQGNYAGGDRKIERSSKQECLNLYKEWFNVTP